MRSVNTRLWAPNSSDSKKKIKELDALMTDPDFFTTNPALAATESSRYQELQAELDEKFLRFLELDERAS